MLDLTDWQNKKYQTKDGYPVRVLCINAKGNYPIVGLVHGKDPINWTRDGRCNLSLEDNGKELINAKTRHEGWVNVYRIASNASCGDIYGSEEQAKISVSPNCVACIKIEWEE